MKYVLYGLVGLLLFAAAAVLVGPSLIDWNAYKAEISDQFEKATGRALVIEGDISLKVVPTPTFSASNVRLANLPGGSAKDMAMVEALLVRVALMPLFQQDFQVQTVELVKPLILLEVLEDGRRNWDFRTVESGATGEAQGRIGDLPVNVRLDNFEIQDATLIYKDAQGGIEESVENIDVDLFAETLRGPFQVKGDALYRSVAGEIELSVGRLSNAGATALRLGFRLPDAEAEASFSGTVSQHPGTLAFRGDLKAKGSDLARAFAELAGQQAANQASQLAVPFTLGGKVSGDDAEVALQQLAITLGTNSASGEASLSLGETSEGRLTISIPRLDLDALAAGGEESAADGGAVDVAAATNALVLPEDFVGKIDVGVEALVYREQVVRQVTLGARIEDGRLAVEQAAALLPGGAAVSLSGELDPGAKQPHFTGRVEAATSNLRSQLAWLGVDVEALPADRLRRMNLKSNFGVSAKQIDLTDLDLTLDLSQIKGGLVVALRRRPAFGIGLAFDKLDLDAYLPVGAGVETAEDTAGEGDAGKSPLSRYDANFNLQIGELLSKGLTFRDVGLAGTLQQSQLTLQDASVGDLAGTRIEASGTLAGFDAEPAADLKVKLGIGDPGRLAKLAGLESDFVGRLGPSEVSGTLKGGTESLDLDLAVNSLGGKLDLAGKLQPLEGPEFDLEVAAKHGNLADLLNRITGSDAAKPLGPLDLRGQLTGTSTAFKISGLEGVLGPGDLRGELAVDLAGARPKFDADLTTGRLPLAALLAAPAALNEGGGNAGGGGGRWSREPIKLDALRGLDAGLKLKADALVFEDLQIEGADVEAELADGTLNLKRLTGDFLGGNLKVFGNAKLADQIEIDAGISAERIDLRPLLQKKLDFDRAAGPVTLNADLVSRGSSQHDLISSLDGQGTIEGTVTLRARPEEQASALLLDLLGQKVQQVKGIADASTLVFSAFSNAPAALSGSFVLEDGVATTRDFQLDGEGAVARLSGQADLAAWATDFTADVFQDSAPDQAFVTLDVKGALDRPGVRVRGAALRPQREEPVEPPTPGVDGPDAAEPLPAEVPESAAPEAEPQSEAAAEPKVQPLEPEIQAEPEAEAEAEATPTPEPAWSQPGLEEPGEFPTEPEVGAASEPEAATVPEPRAKPAKPEPEDFINQILESLKNLPSQ